MFFEGTRWHREVFEPGENHILQEKLCCEIVFNVFSAKMHPFFHKSLYSRHSSSGSEFCFNLLPRHFPFISLIFSLLLCFFMHLFIKHCIESSHALICVCLRALSLLLWAYCFVLLIESPWPEGFLKASLQLSYCGRKNPLLATLQQQFC